MKKSILLLALTAMIFAGCNKDNENETENLSELMIGKWMLTEVKGHVVPTNEKVVYTIESEIMGYISASKVDFTEEQEKWTNHVPCDITVEGNKIIMYGSFNKTTSFEAELDVKSISKTMMLTESKYIIRHNGDTLYASSGSALWTKVPKDYSEDILGKWYGHITSSEGSEFDDGEPHQWEYLADGSYVYYSLDADSNWTSDVNAMSMYFVDGDLLCTRWKNSGEGEVEHREWWEIASIENGVMNWTALRQRDDGTTYTATFSMTKAQ